MSERVRANKKSDINDEEDVNTRTALITRKGPTLTLHTGDYLMLYDGELLNVGAEWRSKW